MKQLRISDNRRYIVTDDGRPFFYLADTAWEIFHRLDEAAAQRYLCNRAGKGFTVIQAVAISEINGIGAPNPYGHLPLVDRDPARPNDAYFRHVDYVVDLANSLGLYVALLPTWGHHVYWDGGHVFALKTNESPVIFNQANARLYGEFLGRRYRDKGVIWVLGGDRPATGVEPVWRAMAEGMRAGDGGTHLITFHPYGGKSSGEPFHAEPWLDFNMNQSGHGRRFNDNYRMIETDYNRTPAKPVLDGEPCYEGIGVAFNGLNGTFTDYDCRIAAWWSVFGGSCGHTYGCSAIWQMWEPKHEPLIHSGTPWYDAVNMPGSYQMRHLKDLMLSRPYLSRIPDRSIVYDNDNPRNHGSDYHAATRDGTRGRKDATYLMVYRPVCCWLNVDTSCIAGDKLRPWWFDPKTGAAYPGRVIDNPRGKWGGDWHWLPWQLKTDQADWVLVVDDASKGYGAPGDKMPV